jgi:muramidase (phage lysozyme)
MKFSVAKKWLSKNYLYLVAVGGAYSLYKIVTYFSGDDISTNGYTKEMKYPKLMDKILENESGTYNDHNYYKNSQLIGYVQGRFGTKYGALTKNLSDYTLGEVMGFQKNARSSSYGQLWATGRYQIIPSTLAGTYVRAGLTLADKYSPANQDKLAMALLQGRTDTWNYLTKKVSDTTANLNAAAKAIAMEWSSVGVPYDMQGHYKWVKKNESYYATYGGSGDVARTKTEDIQKFLKEARKS